MCEYALHDALAAENYRELVASVWAKAFGPIEDLDSWREELWDRHRLRSGYRLGTAHEGEELVGFSWGYTGERGQWFSDMVLNKLGRVAEPWVGGHFEFVELAVIPTARNRGIGGRLHDLLMAQLPHERALLGTSMRPDDPAPRLYEGRGWRHLGSQAPGDQVMAKRLKSPER